MQRRASWIETANTAETDFPLNNLPYGSFDTEDGVPHCGVAIGDMILDVTALEEDGMLLADPYEDEVFAYGDWTEFMALGAPVWASFRARLMDLLAEGAPDASELVPYLIPQIGSVMRLPFHLAEYSVFAAASQPGTGTPIGCHGRASGVVASGQAVRRPWVGVGGADGPVFAPSARFGCDPYLAAIVGQPSDGPVSVAYAGAMIFGYVLIADWSARDGPCGAGARLSNASATSLGPWIVTTAALDPFRVASAPGAQPAFAHLHDPAPMRLGIEVEAASCAMTTTSHANSAQMPFSFAQMLTHHTASGCPMRVGDVLACGPLVGDAPAGGALADGETMRVRGAAQAGDVRIGFGTCSGRVLPALADPFDPHPPQSEDVT